MFKDRVLAAALLSLLVLYTPLTAQSGPEASSRNPQLIALANRGIELFRHDRAATLASETASKERRFRRDQRVAGWITTARDDIIEVTFIDPASLALYRTSVTHDASRPSALEAIDPPETLEEPVADALAAKGAALAADWQPCTDKHNTVVLPIEGSAKAFEVYRIPISPRRNVVPIGGSHRVTVEDGLVTAQRGFTRSCLELEKARNSAALMVTHLLDDTPTEIHVYWSLWAGVPIYVSINTATWKVYKGWIELVGE